MLSMVAGLKANHLSAQRTAQVYAQLPAADIKLEQGSVR